MSAKLITVVALAKAKKGKENEVKALLLGLLYPTRAEKGCVNYDLHQSSENPCEFVFYENWESQGDLDAHLKSAHIASAMSKANAILDGPVKISLWNRIEPNLKL